MLQNWTATCKLVKLEHSLTPNIKINSKWIKDLYFRPETIKLLERNTGRILLDINYYNTKAREIKNQQTDLIKLKSFCIAKEAIEKTKRQPTDWEKILANDMTDKGLILKIHNATCGQET